MAVTTTSPAELPAPPGPVERQIMAEVTDSELRVAQAGARSRVEAVPEGFDLDYAITASALNL